jgi:hypothetical protein
LPGRGSKPGLSTTMAAAAASESGYAPVRGVGVAFGRELLVARGVGVAPRRVAVGFGEGVGLVETPFLTAIPIRLDAIAALLEL